jgi:hypothetical protein
LSTLRSEYWPDSKIIHQQIIERSGLESTLRRYFTQVSFQIIGRAHHFCGVKHILSIRIFVTDIWQTTYLAQRTETKVLYALASEVSSSIGGLRKFDRRLEVENAIAI